MAKSKKMSRDEQIEDVQSRLAAARAKRLEKAKKKETKQELATKEQFSLWWAKNRFKYNKSKDLEVILWAHLCAIGCKKQADFERGIEHFGLKKASQS